MVLCLTISRTFRILAHYEDQYRHVYNILSRFLSITLKQIEVWTQELGELLL